MSENIEVGAVCIGMGATWLFEKNGMECVVIGGLELRAYTSYASGEPKAFAAHCYLVRWADEEITCALPEQLRRKPPPQREEIGEWELCPWQPKQVEAHRA